jgi:hypothetical protein
MDPSNLPDKVYHGTDAASAESIRQKGLDHQGWRAAGGVYGVDEKGFTVTANPETAAHWARIRAGQRGGPAEGVVLEADTHSLPLQQGAPGDWTDPEEFFIRPEDFDHVTPGSFR